MIIKAWSQKDQPSEYIYSSYDVWQCHNSLISLVVTLLYPHNQNYTSNSFLFYSTERTSVQDEEAFMQFVFRTFAEDNFFFFLTYYRRKSPLGSSFKPEWFCIRHQLLTRHTSNIYSSDGWRVNNMSPLILHKNVFKKITLTLFGLHSNGLDEQ